MQSLEGQDMARRAEYARASFILTTATFVFGILTAVAVFTFVIYHENRRNYDYDNDY